MWALLRVAVEVLTVVLLILGVMAHRRQHHELARARDLLAQLAEHTAEHNGKPLPLGLQALVREHFRDPASHRRHRAGGVPRD